MNEMADGKLTKEISLVEYTDAKLELTIKN